MTRKIILFLFSSIFLIVPLILSADTSEMFEIPKMIFIYVATSSILALFVFDFIKNTRTFKISRLTILFLIFLVSQVASYYLSIDRYTSFFGYYGRFNGGLLSTLIFFMFFVVTTQFSNGNFFKIILKASVIASMLVLLWGLPGRFFGVDSACIYFRGEFSNECWTNEFRPAERMFSTLGQPNWLGTYFAAHVFIGIFIFLSQTKKVEGKITNLNIRKYLRFTPILYSVFMLLGVYLTGSRSSMISVIVPIILEIFILLSKKIKRQFFITLISVVLIALIFGGGYYTYSVINGKKSDITHSGKIRLIVWEGAVKLWAKYPVFGTGPETFAYAYYQTRPESHNLTTEKDFIYNKAHNEFLNMLSTTGAFGFVAYTFVITYGIYLLLKSDNADKAIAYALISISISNFFGFSTSTSQLLLYFLLGYAANRELNVAEKLNISLGFLHNIFAKLPLYLLTVLGWIYLIMFFEKYVVADITYATSQNIYETGSPIKAVSLCLEAYELKHEHIYADRCASMAASTALLLAGAESDELVGYRDSFITLTNSLSSIALRSSPQNPIYIKSRLRVLKALQKLQPKNKDYINEKNELIKRFRHLAPTDHAEF